MHQPTVAVHGCCHLTVIHRLADKSYYKDGITIKLNASGLNVCVNNGCYFWPQRLTHLMLSGR